MPIVERLRTTGRLRSSVGDMPRPLRPQIPGASHHVTARGVDGCTIYRDDRDLWEGTQTGPKAIKLIQGYVWHPREQELALDERLSTLNQREASVAAAQAALDSAALMPAR